MFESLKGTLTINDIAILLLIMFILIFSFFAVVEHNIDKIKRRRRLNRNRK